MFSMVAVATSSLEHDAPNLLDAATLARFGVLQGTSAAHAAPKVLTLEWPELERLLPDRGLPRGVIELAMPVTISGTSGASRSRLDAMRGGATTVALAAVRAVHRSESQAFCAWLTPTNTPSLHAPRAVQVGVDLERLLVVRPEPLALARTAVKVATSGAFDLVVIDALAGLGGKVDAVAMPSKSARAGGGRAARRVDGAIVVRKLALASEEHGTTFLILTNAHAPRSSPWPVALRIEVERRHEAISVRVTKDRFGRASSHGSPTHVRVEG